MMAHLTHLRIVERTEDDDDEAPLFEEDGSEFMVGGDINGVTGAHSPTALNFDNARHA